jgi:hypothetical protein
MVEDMSKSANMRALNSVLGVPANAPKLNSVAAVASNVSQSMRNSATDSINSITNSIKSLNASIKTPLEESIASVPTDAAPLGMMLPLILGIGALVIALVLLIYYRANIENSAYAAYDYVNKFVKGTKEGAPPPPPPEQNPLEYPIQQQDQDLPSPQTDVVNKIVPGKKQVFNVSANKYTYNDAEPLCRAMGAELATYDQVKQAWDHGADWCNYGWVKGQAAVYPTQQSTFDELQSGSSDDERLACGQPGVNGGFFDNPELHFGVNCYGEKPSKTSNDLRVTNENMHPPQTPDALKQKKKELAYKAHIDQIGILPFRAQSWSD